MTGEDGHDLPGPIDLVDEDDEESREPMPIDLVDDDDVAAVSDLSDKITNLCLTNRILVDELLEKCASNRNTFPLAEQERCVHYGFEMLRHNKHQQTTNMM